MTDLFAVMFKGRTILPYKVDHSVKTPKSRKGTKLDPPIHTALAGGDIDVVRAAINEDATGIDAVDRLGRTALMYAVADGKVDIVRLLLERGADPNARDANGYTALHFATQGPDPLMATFLLEAGAEVDAQDKNGNTPLSNAVFSSRGHGELIALLLSKGADMNLENAYGVSPLGLAKSIGNYDVAKFLE